MKDEIKQKTSPRNFFLHLLSIVTLYASAISLLTVLFQYINLLLPDALEQYYNFQLYQGRLRVALSVLVVVFPVYIWSMWYLKKLYIPPPDSHKGQNGKLMIIGGSHLFHAASLWALEVASRIVDMVFYSSVPENNQIVKKTKEAIS